MSSEWVAAYYPSDLIENQRVKTLFCLLFDKVVFHFPISHMGCGGGSGISDYYCEDPLVDEGVLELAPGGSNSLLSGHFKIPS